MREKWKIKQKNLLFKVRNSHLELEKDFIELKDIQLKNREVKIKKDYCVYRWYGKVLKKKRNEEKKTNEKRLVWLVI